VTNASKRGFLRGKGFSHSPDVVRPPWTGSAQHFSDRCTRCDNCITACPEKILIQGDGGFPEVDFRLGECTFCTECASVCDEDVFQSSPLEAEDAWTIVAGILPACLSLNAVLCRSCAEHCPADAISIRLHTGGISEPLINLDDCIGCGACLYVCPKDSVLLKYRLPQTDN